MAEAAKEVAVKELDQLEAPDLLEQMIGTGVKPRGGDAGRERAQQLLKTYVSELLDPGMPVPSWEAPPAQRRSTSCSRSK